MSEVSKKAFRITIGFLIILSTILLTANLIRVLPAFAKVIGVLANVFVIYLVIDWVKNKNKKSKV